MTSDAVRQVLEYAQQLVKVLPKDAVSYDDASNNRALISGQSAMIWNPPLGLGGGQARQSAGGGGQLELHGAGGAEGPVRAVRAVFLGRVEVQPEQDPRAKELIEFLMQRENVEARCVAVSGYDVPPFDSMLNFKVWEDVEPPKGTVYNYPLRPQHKGVVHIAALPAPPEIAVQIYNQGTMPTMLAGLQRGQTIPQVIAWAKNELEGFVSLAAGSGAAPGARPGRRPFAYCRGEERDGQWRNRGDSAWRRHVATGQRRPAAFHAEAVDHRLPHVLAADPADRRAGGVPRRSMRSIFRC